MPGAGVPARAARRQATPWWEELDREAFRDFPAAPRKARAETADRPTQERPASARPAGARVAQERPASARPAGARAAQERAGGATDGRRTVTIRGYGAERNLPVARPTLRRHERPGFRPDRAALWAVALGLFLILVAATSAHAAVLH